MISTWRCNVLKVRGCLVVWCEMKADDIQYITICGIVCYRRYTLGFPDVLIPGWTEQYWLNHPSPSFMRENPGRVELPCGLPRIYLCDYKCIQLSSASVMHKNLCFLYFSDIIWVFVVQWNRHYGKGAFYAIKLMKPINYLVLPYLYGNSSVTVAAWGI